MKKLVLVLSSIFLFTMVCKSQTIPNGGFENWKSVGYDEPDSSWYTSNPYTIASDGVPTVTKVAGHFGQAVHIQTSIVGVDTLIGYVTNEPGIPYSQKPTAITGYYRCNMAGKDTGVLAFEFEKNGTPVQFVSVPFTGNVSTFTPFKMTFSLSSIPDTVMMIASSSNIVNNIDITSGSWIELDQIAFTGTGITQPIPGGSFDNWTSNSYDIPTGWQVSNTGDPSSGVTKSTDHDAGNYSVQLITQPDSTAAEITTGQFDQYGDVNAGQPYTLTADTIIGYYKYSTSGKDTGGLFAYLQNNGNIVGIAAQKFLPVATWTTFELPISAVSTPDSLRVDVYSSFSPSPVSTNIPGSTLLLDNLQLKSQPLVSGVKSTNYLAYDVSAFPDPASNVLHIKFNQTIASSFNIKLFDIAGQLLFTSDYSAKSSLINLTLDQYKPGIYFYDIASNGVVTHNKFIKN